MKHYFIREPPFCNWMNGCPVYIKMSHWTVPLIFILQCLSFNKHCYVIFHCISHAQQNSLFGTTSLLLQDSWKGWFTSHWFFSFPLFLIYSDQAFFLHRKALSDLHWFWVSSQCSPHRNSVDKQANCFVQHFPRLLPGQLVLLVLLHFWLLLLFFLNIVCWFSSFTSHAGGFPRLRPWTWSFPSLCLLFKRQRTVSWLSKPSMNTSEL